ncbi:MAG: signal recognition particle-docking protein FtsY [Woeseia sp.]|nr:signal recognition particle-docking protein FtsY [Woeseia sp.]MBT8097251.1 signal recognition particle-docking protein FtsY [Woeseia sp.]NNE59778.1 signal recognition particle-docking protein FtsY [Woeseia sp.]NNL54675.1 signal recognition particle-docking protein FtsY [Woeseia sp.]
MFGRKKNAESGDSGDKVSFVKRLRARLNRGDSWLTYDLANLVPGGKIDEDVIDELESRLVMADVGVDTAMRIVADLHRQLARKELSDAEALLAALRKSLLEILEPIEQNLHPDSSDGPFVILMVGVNGAGKTTTIGKLARRCMDNGQSVMLAAGDTFRAAAVEQLTVWGERNKVPVIAQHAGADPAAVIFDAYEAATSRNIDVLLADTAGRLQNQQGLMDELSKIKRVLQRKNEAAPHEVMLVLDAGLGQNALSQAEKFHAALGVTGIAITKLDGSAKGGVLLAIADKLKVPVRYIGIGEAIDDMQPFVASDFVDALLQTGPAPQ